MTLTASVIDSVTTGDAVPTTVPHKISQQGTKNRATVVFHVTQTGPTSRILAYRVTFTGNRRTGTNVGSKGIVCGIARCGVAPTRPLNIAVQSLSEDVDYSELPSSADGGYEVDLAVYGDAREVV